MATINISVSLTNPAGSTTQNVFTGDTLNITATNTVQPVSATATNASVSPSTDSTSPYNFAVTNFTSSTYSVSLSSVLREPTTGQYYNDAATSGANYFWYPHDEYTGPAPDYEYHPEAIDIWWNDNFTEYEVSNPQSVTSVTLSGYTYYRGDYVQAAPYNGALYKIYRTSPLGRTVSGTVTTSDTTPDQFTFTDVTNVALSSPQTSNSITISGINATTSVSVSGGTYSKNGGAFTSAAGTAVNGDTFRVNHTSSSSFLTDTNTTLTVGGVSDTFTSTTAAQDTTPDNFVNFTSQTGVSTSSLCTSNIQTITGITGNVSVSVSGDGSPEISVAGGAFSSSATTISNGQTIQVRLTSSASTSTTHTATVTIGTVARTFSATTHAPGGSGGSTDGSGDLDYGVEFYDTDGTTKVLSAATRYVSVMNDVVAVTVPAASGSVNGSVLIQQDMTNLTTSNSDLVFIEQYPLVSIHRVTTGPVSGQGFRLENSTDTAQTVTPFIIRF